MKNAMYLDSGWFSGDISLTDDQRNDYVYLLQDHGINQQFCDIGVIQESGAFPSEGHAMLKEWIAMSRRVDPVQEIILVLNYGKRKSSVQFGTPRFNTALSKAVSNLLATYDVNGIHLDIEGFLPNDTKLIALLKLLKTQCLAQKHLSISTPTAGWTDAYIRQVAQIVDQVNPMIYDTMGWGSEVVDSTTFKAYFKRQIMRYTDALKGTKCELVPTLPVYELKKDGDVVYHDPAAENLKTALAGLNEAINEGASVSGAGIFWGPHFLGLYPKVYDLYKDDQAEWDTNWLGKE